MPKGETLPAERDFKRNFGWVGPSPPDIRDLKFAYPYTPGRALPTVVDLTPGIARVLNQGDIGACGPHTLAALIEYQEKKQGFVDAQTPSRLFLYYVTRVLMGTVNEDSGVYNRAMLKALAQNGYCEETFWGYVTSKFKQKPPQPAYTDALKSVDIKYHKVAQTLEAMKQCLADGNPFIFGHMVYPSYMEADNGDVPYPGQSEQPIGGHDVLICAYRDDIQRFIFLNSWGEGWGRRGFGSVPFNYATNPNLSSDFWTITYTPADTEPEPVPPNPPNPPDDGDGMNIIEFLKLVWPVVSRLIDSAMNGSSVPAWMKLIWPRIKAILDAWLSGNNKAGLKAVSRLLNEADSMKAKLKLKA